MLGQLLGVLFVLMFAVTAAVVYFSIARLRAFVNKHFLSLLVAVTLLAPIFFSVGVPDIGWSALSLVGSFLVLLVVLVLFFIYIAGKRDLSQREYSVILISTYAVIVLVVVFCGFYYSTGRLQSSIAGVLISVEKTDSVKFTNPENELVQPEVQAEPFDRILKIFLTKCALPLRLIFDSDAGLRRNVENSNASFQGSPRLIDGMYFSIVTFTTLGYGDFQPLGVLRYVAALEALCGYILLAMLVGVILKGYADKEVSREGQNDVKDRKSGSAGNDGTTGAEDTNAGR